MKFSYAIPPQRRMIFQAFEGRFTVAQLIECTQRVWADPNYDKTFNGIVDVTRVEASADLSDLRALIAFVKADKQTSVGRWAVITASPLATAGALLYKRAMAPHHMFEVFSTWESAGTFLQWEEPCPELSACIISAAAEPTPVV